MHHNGGPAGRRDGCAIESLEGRVLLSTATSVIISGPGNPSESIAVRHLTDVNGAIYFSAGRSLLRFNPASGASSVVKTFWGIGKPGDHALEGSTTVSPHNLIAINNTLFFTFNDNVHGEELWTSDGTSAGTVLVKDLLPGVEDSDLQNLTVYKNKLYFTANDDSGSHLWRSDGTRDGTVPMADVSAVELTPAYGRLYFMSGQKLWRTDGTVAGTKSVVDLAHDVRLMTAGDVLYSLDNGTTLDANSSKLRAIAADGTVTTLFTGSGETEEGDGGVVAAALHNQLFFTLPDAAVGQELWVTDGTLAGTRLVQDLLPGPVGSSPGGFVATSSALYFTTSTEHTFEHFTYNLWRTDGSAKGTRIVATSEDWAPEHFRPVGKRLYYEVTNSGVFEVDDSHQPPRKIDQLTLGQNLVMPDGSILTAGTTEITRYQNGELSAYPVLTPDAVADAPIVRTAGQRIYTFNVTFTSRIGLRLSGYDGLHFDPYDYHPVIQVTGPNGFSSDALFMSADRASQDESLGGSAVRTITYGVVGPGGTWNAGDEGTYTISSGGAVKDVFEYGPTGVIGHFQAAAPISAHASIGGSVFYDSDIDGAHDAAEKLAAGYRVFIDANHNGRWNAGEIYTRSDSTGRWTLDGLSEGNYQLGVTAAGDLVSTSGPQKISVFAGEEAYLYFGLSRGATAAGTVFNDLNDDAIRESREPGLGGLTVWADLDDDGKLDANEAKSVTNADGTYQLSVPMGTTRIRTSVPRNYGLTVGGAQLDQLAAAQVSSDLVGLTRKASVSGSVIYDYDGDGSADQYNRSAAGAIVYVDSNRNGQFDLGEPSDTTDENGKFLIRSVPAGDWTARVDATGSWIPTTPDVPVHLLPGGSAHATFSATPKGTLSGICFDDQNLDHQFEDGEPGIAGCILFLDYNHNGQLNRNEPRQVTGSDGRYTFLLPADGYTLVEIPPDGWRAITNTAAPINLDPDEFVQTDFGSSLAGLISGHIIRDPDGDRVPNGQLVDGVLVWLDQNNNGEWDYNEDSQVIYSNTDAFVFLNKTPGTYWLRIGQWSRSVEPVLPGSGSFKFTLRQGQSLTNFKFSVRFPNED